MTGDVSPVAMFLTETSLKLKVPRVGLHSKLCQQRSGEHENYKITLGTYFGH